LLYRSLCALIDAWRAGIVVTCGACEAREVRSDRATSLPVFVNCVASVH
jgi:hypothetical protein